jgi:hypothetical protein
VCVCVCVCVCVGCIAETLLIKFLGLEIFDKNPGKIREKRTKPVESIVVTSTVLVAFRSYLSSHVYIPSIRKQFVSNPFVATRNDEHNAILWADRR